MHNGCFVIKNYRNTNERGDMYKQMAHLVLMVFFLAGCLHCGRIGSPIDVPSQGYPSFPWPPPRATVFMDIDRDCFSDDSPPAYLKEVACRLEAALSRSGYVDRSYYSIVHGFALVTRIEQINADGTSKENDVRWRFHHRAPAKFDLRAYLQSLLMAQPGIYRVIVFTVTDVPTMQSAASPSLDEVNAWLSGGMNFLPSFIGNNEFTEDYHCTAYIYEFSRQTEDHPVVMDMECAITALQHLEKAGIMEGLRI